MVAIDSDVQSAVTVREVVAAVQATVQSPAIPTGFTALDVALDGGLRAQDLTILGGRPGVGKTIAALQWARHIARRGAQAIFICYEHTEQQLLTRLLVGELGALAQVENRGRIEKLQREARLATAGMRTFAEFSASDPLAAKACEELDGYADRLLLLRASGARTDLAALEAIAATHHVEGGALFIDYLQKIPSRTASSERDRVIRLAQGLKELALSQSTAVVAVASCDTPGLTARRARLHDIRGSAAVAYEADVAIMLNEKASAVSKVHLAYDPVRAREFRNRVVFSVEKNRGGPAPVDLEFAKDFASYRFDPTGSHVSDQLVDGLIHVE